MDRVRIVLRMVANGWVARVQVNGVIEEVCAAERDHVYRLAVRQVEEIEEIQRALREKEKRA